LKSSKPIIPIKEYERMIVGRFDANYVGTDNCLAACHFHDDERNYLEASTHGLQISKKSGMPLVNCETCHGPGSLAIEGLTPEQVEKDAAQGKQTECKYETLIQITDLPAQAQTLVCLKCHTANATFNLHTWNVGSHNINDVSCNDCHDIHAGPDIRVEPDKVADTCTKCHMDVKAEFSLPSRHPVSENRVFCSDCHEPHGSVNDKQLKGTTEKDTCTQCHTEKEGPFVYEHADLTEDCMSCHSPHGSVNNNLLNIRVPFLCLQCHAGHRTSSTVSIESKGTFYTRCTDCHSQIHGSDTPSVSNGTFIH
jgi:DmsE family decaheme c-type cytochrome